MKNQKENDSLSKRFLKFNEIKNLLREYNLIHKSKELGKGQYGIVYAGNVGCYKVAIKQFYEEEKDDENNEEDSDYMTNSETEYEVSSEMGKLVSNRYIPHIVLLVACLQYNNAQQYELVYELGNMTLCDAIEHKNLSEKELASLVLQILFTLYVLAREKKVHNDLYCTNIIIFINKDSSSLNEYVLNNKHYYLNANITARINDWGPQPKDLKYFPKYAKKKLENMSDNTHVFDLKMGTYCRDLYAFLKNFSKQVANISKYYQLKNWAGFELLKLFTKVKYDPEHMERNEDACRDILTIIERFPMGYFLGSKVFQRPVDTSLIQDCFCL